MLGRRGIVLLLVIAAALAAVVYLSEQVFIRMADLRAAPQDNVQWSLAQLDVELLAFELAASEPQASEPDGLKRLRQRFDVFYSRANIVASMPPFHRIGLAKEISESINLIKSTTQDLATTIDIDDVSLRSSLPMLRQRIEALRLPTRQISLAGVKTYASEADQTRRDLAHLLWQTALVNAVLIFAICAALAFLVRQFAISRRNAAELEASSARNASTVNASLDAIVVVNMNGEIVEFNPAAVQTFGYSRSVAVGSRLSELVIPERMREAHEAGMKRLRETGKAKLTGTGRFEIEALNADGHEFPVEMSLAVSVSPGGPIVTAFMRDISKRHNQEAELKRARDEALKASHAKSQFLAVMSHEMRTPLNGVMALLDLLKDTKLSKKQNTYVQTATTSAEILKQHVDDVLDLTRMQAGKLELSPRVFNLVELLEEIQSLNLATARRRGNEIRLEVDMPEPYFIADRKRLHQVLTNLMSNAIKFTQNGRITLKAQCVDVNADLVGIEFSVSDTGAGIPKSLQAKIFEEFVTLDMSFQREASGTGLGLPICREIVEGMQGTISVESEVGLGSTFSFRIAMKAAFADHANERTNEGLKPARTGRHWSRFLVVEDNETNRFVARELLTSMGCAVTLAVDGVAGIEAAARNRFDGIFMDLSMPNMNGWEAAKKIKTGNGKSRKSKIFALTAHVLPEDETAQLRLVMDGILTKPLRRADLQALLEGLSNSEAAATSHSVIKDGTVDIHVHAEMKGLLGIEKYFQRLDQFSQELKVGYRSLEKLAKLGDRVEFRNLSHRLAGSCAVFGAVKLADEFRNLEMLKALRSFAVRKQKLLNLIEMTGAALEGMSA